MALPRFLEIPLFTAAKVRSLGYSLESAALRLIAKAIPSKAPFVEELSIETIQIVEQELNSLLKKDSAAIRQGLYPISVLSPENPQTHLRRIPRLLWDAVGVARRRSRGRTTEFSKSAQEYADDSPRYFRRNFHFQTDGYLSEKSAELYEHQVELLFLGGADAMRRLILPPLKGHFGAVPGQTLDGRGLKFLELAAGTGRATGFVSAAFPRAQVIASDLSAPYLNVAKKRMASHPRVSVIQADATKLPFKDGEFDAVYSVFLFHELPLEQRKEVLAECLRVVKPGGFIGWVDSLQKGDRPPLDHLLEKFPQLYHEPFYRNYIETPMEELWASIAESRLERETGFFSKVNWTTRPSESLGSSGSHPSSEPPQA